MEEELKYPYIVFKLQESLYCISSQYITSLVQLPHYTKVPSATSNITGVFRYRDTIIQMVDLRTTLGIETLAKEYEDFSKMIDVRKQDHINWVNELERAAINDEPFTLSSDPHQCAFGHWYDTYETDNTLLAYQLNKLDEPHKKLHGTAELLKNCTKDCDNCNRDECLKTTLTHVKDENMPIMLNLLDQTKEIFASTIYKEMVLLIADTSWGLVVDEVVGVEELESINRLEHDMLSLQSLRYIKDVKEHGKGAADIIFELNLSELFQGLHPLEAPEQLL